MEDLLFQVYFGVGAGLIAGFVGALVGIFIAVPFEKLHRKTKERRELD